MIDTFIFSLELVGAAAFAISGAMVAIKCKMDIFGVCVLGLVTAVGGGATRDIILGNTPPAMFSDPIYAIVALGISLIVFIPHVRRFIMKMKNLMNFTDAVGLGIFTVSGTFSALQTVNANIFLAVFVGVITGVGGGLIRDTLAKQIPYIFTKHVYALAAIMGALLFCILYEYLDGHMAMLIAAAFIVIIRMLAAIFRWNLPKPKNFS